MKTSESRPVQFVIRLIIGMGDLTEHIVGFLMLRGSLKLQLNRSRLTELAYSPRKRLTAHHRSADRLLD